MREWLDFWVFGIKMRFSAGLILMNFA